MMNFDDFVNAVSEAICESNVESRWDIHELGIGVEAMRVATLIGELDEWGDTVYDEGDVDMAVDNMWSYMLDEEEVE